MPGSKIYFASDFHLGVPNVKHSDNREREICRWLDHIKPDASDLYLVGDLFDFWYEYKTVIPKGFIRFQGKLAELADAGIQIHIFTGNHDMWMFQYFEEQLGAKMYRKPISIQFGTKKYFIGHGDGLGPGDFKYKFIKFKFTKFKLIKYKFTKFKFSKFTTYRGRTIWAACYCRRIGQR